MHEVSQVSTDKTVLQFAHKGPLRVLKSLYPEGPGVCHNVLVHPPSGLVGGDTLDIQVTVATGAHGLVTTPGATRFYRSEAGLATQQVHARVESGARLEWLPLEAIAYNQCDALNRAVFDLAPGAEMMAWDLTAFGHLTPQTSHRAARAGTRDRACHALAAAGVGGVAARDVGVARHLPSALACLNADFLAASPHCMHL